MIETPKLSAACAFHHYDNGGGRKEYVLCIGEGRQFKVSALARNVLSRFDGTVCLDEVAAGLNAEAVPITVQQLEAILSRYAALGAFETGAAGQVPAAAARPALRPGFPLLLAWDLLPQPLVSWLALRLKFLYAPVAAITALPLIAWTHYTVYAQKLDAAALSPASFLWIIGLSIASILFHELGHAAAVSRFGGTPGKVGCGLYLLMPTFYADVSQIWRFSRRQRMVVDLGGAYFQQMTFVGFALAALWSGRPELTAACRMIDLMVLMALNPIFRFDGYWFLVDYLAMPKLYTLALRYPYWWLRRRFGRPVAPLALPHMSRFGRWLFSSYSVLASTFLVAALWLSYHYLSTTLVQFPQVAPHAFFGAVTAFQSGDVSLFLIRAITCFFLIAFPATALIGIALYLGRIIRLLSDWVRRRMNRLPAKANLARRSI
jgi:putative peptide zinc metalloprotease protein